MAVVRVLVGDLGGSKSELVVYERVGSKPWNEIETGRLASKDHAGPTEVIRAFLGKKVARFDAVGLAVAGPVHDTRCRFTNLDWEIDARALGEELGAPVAMVNDFVANAHGLAELAPADLVVLQAGSVDPDGPIGLIGAGTGLGHAVAIRDADRLRVLPSQGAYADFAPRDDTELGFWRFLRARHGMPVACERAVSGSGLTALWEFVVEHGLATARADLRVQMANADPASVVMRHALDGSDPACERALSMFLSLYGSVAGNFALEVLPTGGLYVAGGIAPRMVDAMRRGEFMQAFLAKDRCRELLAQIPVSLVLEPRVGLLGARALAAATAARSQGD